MEHCIPIYNEFLDTIKSLTKEDLTEFRQNPEKRLEKFYMSLSKDDLFLLFSMAKIKVFSAKTVETHELSISLFNEAVSLKHLFNNQTDEIKSKLWELLFNMYIQLEKKYNNNQERISTLKEAIKKVKADAPEINNERAEKFKTMLKKDVNSQTSNMLEDIIGSFQSVLSNKGNPFDSIMSITENITSKYGKMIEQGDIQIDKILGSVTSVIGTTMNEKEEEEPVIIDENFSTSNVDIGKEEEEESSGFDLKKLAKLMPLTNMMNKIGTLQSPDELLSIKEEMDSFMKNELKVDMSEYKDQIGQMEQRLLGMANKNVEDLNNDLNIN
jgi:hypothetical protein